MSDPLPVDVVEAAVQVAGVAFHYKRPLQLLMNRAGVPDTMWSRYEQDSKYKIARNIFGDLEAKGEAGLAIQRKIVQELSSLRAFPPEVNAASASKAVEHLRKLSRAARLESEIESRERQQRVAENDQRHSDAKFRENRLEELKQRFYMLLASDDEQTRGYELEKLLEDLFSIFGLEYRHSYKTPTEQVDGAFKFGAFDYLVEVKWTRDETNIATLDSFKGRVSRRITSTRGLFCSIAGYRDEVVSQFATGSASSVLLMTGEDLTYILEGRCSLIDALQHKADKAAHEGAVLVRLADRF